jgi:hypothetical protein
MPFCPRCKYEFDASVLVCPDCDRVLVDYPGDTRQSAAVRPDDSWVVVGDVDNAVDSRTAKGSLDSNNIPAMMLPADMTRIDATVQVVRKDNDDPEDQHMIMVPREYREEAVSILKAVLGDDFGDNIAGNP